MAIQRWDPFRDVVSLRDAVNSLFQDSLGRIGPEGNAGPGVIGLPIDVAENENEFVVKASMPGLKPEDVHITVHGDSVTIRGETRAEEEKKGETWHVRERRHGVFQRGFVLATPIDAEKSAATFENGVITLKLPKSEKARPKQIKVAPKDGGT